MLGEFSILFPKKLIFGNICYIFSFMIKINEKCPPALGLYLKLEYLKDVGYTIYLSELNYTQFKCTTSS